MPLARAAASPRLWASVLCCAASLVTPRSALAERPLEQALTLEETQCFERQALSREIAKWLGRARLDDRLALVVVPGTEPSSGSVAFSILRDGQVVVDRQLSKVDAPCTELRSAVALAIAIAIESTLVEERKKAATTRPAAAPPPPPAEAPRSPPRRARAASLGISVTAFVGLLPRPTWGASIDASVPLARPLDLRAALFASALQNTSLGTGNADLQIAAARLDGCFVRDPGTLRFRACAGASLGRLFAEGHDYAESRVLQLTWASASARLDLRLPLSRRFGALLALDGWVPLTRPTLDVRSEQGQILSESRLPAAGASASLGVDVEIW